MQTTYSNTYHCFLVEEHDEIRRIGFELETLARLIMLRAAWESLQRSLALVVRSGEPFAQGKASEGMWIRAWLFDEQMQQRYESDVIVTDACYVTVCDQRKPAWLPERVLRIGIDRSDGETIVVEGAPDRQLAAGDTIGAGDRFEPDTGSGKQPVPPAWIGQPFAPEEHVEVTRPGPLEIRRSVPLRLH